MVLSRFHRRLFVLLCVFAAAAVCVLVLAFSLSLAHAQDSEVVLPTGPPPTPLPPLSSPIRGMTVSAQTNGTEWATPAMAQTLDELKTLGVNAISIHPYAQVREDGHIAFSDRLDEAHITQPLDWARERGLGVMLIPHLAHWGTRFSWRGEISFATDEEWNRFFDDYQKWMVTMGKIAQAHGAGVLCIGLEYTHAQMFEGRWRDIIAAVRAVYGGKLTYGGNWDSYQQVGFYDALDYLGVLAYFPLTTKPDPDVKQLAAGWEKHLPGLRAFSKKLGDKPVLFVEIGYNESARAASDPWNFQKGGPNAVEVQSHCMEAALRLLEKEYSRGLLAGMFWWKWFPPIPHMHEENFDMREPAPKKVIATFWKRPAAPTTAAAKIVPPKAEAGTGGPARP